MHQNRKEVVIVMKSWKRLWNIRCKKKNKNNWYYKHYLMLLHKPFLLWVMGYTFGLVCVFFSSDFDMLQHLREAIVVFAISDLFVFKGPSGDPLGILYLFVGWSCLFRQVCSEIVVVIADDDIVIGVVFFFTINVIYCRDQKTLWE